MELEQLPKVAPPFSLVDSILPKLEQMELATGSAQQADGPAGQVIPVQFGWKQRIKKINLQALGGVVAAGVIIGLFIVANPPKSLDSANNSGNMAKSSSANMDTAASNEPTAERSTAMKQEAAASSNTADNASSADEAQVTKEVEHKATTFAREAPKEEEMSAVPAVPQQQEDPETVTESMNGGASEGVTDSEPSAGEMGVVQDQNGNELQPSTGAGESDKGTMGIAASPDLNPKDKDEHTGSDSSNSSVTKDPEPSVSLTYAQRVASPNELYTATVTVNNQIVISEGELENIIYASFPRKGEVSNVRWSEDSSVLSYDVTQDTGIQHYVIDLAAGTEVNKQ
jgi:hypothetical protein